MPIEVGQIIPEGTFKYVPYSSELDDPVSVLCIFPNHVLIAYFLSSLVVSVSMDSWF